MYSALTMFVALIASHAWAHKPSFANDYFNAGSAFTIDDPDVSIVLYAEMTCTESELWMQMETVDRNEIWVELGVPMLDRLETYRPALALVAPGLPDVDLPFDIPANMGANIIETDDVDDPLYFYEPFTQTESWILYQGWMEVPANEEVFLVSWNPSEFTGKLWVAVGKTEDFSDVGVDQFAEWVEKTQAYYEFDDDEEHTELDCSLVSDPPGMQDQPTKEGGCSTIPSHDHRLGPAVFFLMLFMRRRHPDALT